MNCVYYQPFKICTHSKHINWFNDSRVIRADSEIYTVHIRRALFTHKFDSYQIQASIDQFNECTFIHMLQWHNKILYGVNE